ncbi:MAG: ABC transporter substrate-binding protein [Caulobacteraceae bacterium]|nr:ABC transporter substrate-binding protein [Caulobacter sp.]
MRVVSLLPSATEIAVAVGCGPGVLVGRSHECDFPPWVEALPVVTATKLEKGLGSQAIEDRVQAIVRQGLSVYEVDAPLLRALKPDVILTQSQCAVCAVTPADLEEALAGWIGAPPALLSLAPNTLSDAWDDVRRVGAAVGAAAAAGSVVAGLEARMAALAARMAARALRPTVAAIEWIEPLMAAGNWVPELVEIAGGAPLFAARGQHSPWLAWDELTAADPDVIVLMPCGYRIAQAAAELPLLAARPGWNDLAAVRAGRVYAADGHHFFNRPGPRLAESAEILAEILDDAAGGAPPPEGRWVRLGTRALRTAS